MDAIVERTALAHLSNGYSIRMGGRSDCAMRWPFTGRETELDLVSAALSGRSAEGVVIAGPAGVGKTRLTAEAAELAGARGCAVEWARASRSARTIPLGAFAALLPGAGGRPGWSCWRALARRWPSARPAAGSSSAWTTGSSSTTPRRRSCISSWPPARPSPS